MLHNYKQSLFKKPLIGHLAMKHKHWKYTTGFLIGSRIVLHLHSFLQNVVDHAGKLPQYTLKALVCWQQQDEEQF